MINYKKKYLKYKKKYLNLKNKLKGGGEEEYNYKKSIETFLDETIIKKLGGQIDKDKGYYWIILEGMEKEGNCWSDILYEKEKEKEKKNKKKKKNDKNDKKTLSSSSSSTLCLLSVVRSVVMLFYVHR